MEPETLLSLPCDAQIEVALALPYHDIIRLCQTNRALHDCLCGNDAFWRLKFRGDFGDTTTRGSYRDLYRQYYFSKVYTFGNSSYVGIQSAIPYQLDLSLQARMVACGIYHSLILDLDYNVHVLGLNDYGQLGTGDYHNSKVPIPIGYKAKYVACGGDSSFLIDLSDNVYAFGLNHRGQLGTGDSINRKTPALTGFKAQEISSGTDHTLMIDLEGNLYSCGSNRQGQLGLGHVGTQYLPTDLGFKAKKVSAGSHYSVVITMRDLVVAFGANRSGQGGLGEAGNLSVIPNLVLSPEAQPFLAREVSARDNFTLLLDLDDNLWITGKSVYDPWRPAQRPKRVPFDRKVKSVAAGYNNGAVIDFDNNLWVFGTEGGHRLGGIPDNSRLTQIPGFIARHVALAPSFSIVIGDYNTSI